MELVDMLDLGSSALRRESSSLSLGTTLYFKYFKAVEFAHVFRNMHKGGRQNGRHFPT